MPLLTLLLPIKVEALAPDDKVALLSLITLAGAVVASFANILAGVFSDITVRRGRTRRPWVVGGLAATLASYAAIHLSSTPGALTAAVIGFQIALNFLLAPLIALAADEVPDAQKGALGGVFGAAHPLGSLAAIGVTASAAWEEAGQFALLTAMIVAAVLPFVAVTRGRLDHQAPAAPPPPSGRTNLPLVWMARLLMQMAGSILFTYLLFYFQTVDAGAEALGPRELPGRVARLSGLVTLLSVPLAIVIGRASDKAGARKPFLAGAALVVTTGLLLMALTPSWTPAAIGYGLFACGIGIFLALHSAYTMQLLPTPGRRGRDLGVFNLTNTLPNIAAPALAYVLADLGGFRPLLLTLALLTAAAGVMMLFVRERP